MLVTILQFAAGILAGAAWLFLVYIGKADASVFVGTLQTLLGALIVHLVNQTTANNALPVPAVAKAAEPAPAATGPSGQQGFARPLYLLTLAIACIGFTLLLGGCATAYRAGFESTLTSAKAADDNLVLTEKTAMCALPLSAILRNADIIPGIKALCLPGGNASDPNGILPDPQHAPVQVQIVPNNPQGK